MSQASLNPSPPVLLDRAEAVAIVTLNRPKVINALSEEMLNALQHVWDELAEDREVRAVVLRGSGEHFCAGHDLKEMTRHRGDTDGGHSYFVSLFARCSKMMLAMVQLPQPIVAEVSGIATAAGCQLVASCDLAVASEDARFATSGVNIGLFCSTPMVALSRVVSRKRAMEMLLLGEFVCAEQAAAYGLVNAVVSAAELPGAALTMAQKIATKSSAAVKTGKAAFYRQAEMGLAEAYAYAGQVMADNMMARDTEQGINAFIDKQPMPSWSGQ